MKALVRLIVKFSCLEMPGSAKLVGWPGLLACEFLEKSRCIPWHWLWVAVAADNSVAHIGKW